MRSWPAAPTQRVPTLLNPRRSLRARLGLAFGGIALLLSVALSLIVGQLARSQVQRDIGLSLEQLSYQMTDRLDRGMFARYRDIEIAAILDVFRNPTAHSQTEQRNLLEKMQSTYTNYAWIGMLDAGGTVLASTGGLLEGQDLSQRPVYQNGKLGAWAGDVHEAVLLAKLLPPNANGDPLRFVDVAAPVYDNNDRLVGVLAANLNWTWANDIKTSLLQLQPKSSPVEMLVLSKDDAVLLGPSALLGQKVSGGDGPDSFAVERWADGADYLTGWSHSRGYLDYHGLGWTVLLYQPTDLAFAPANDLQRTILIWGAFLGAIFVLLGWFIAGRITSPLLRIAAIADTIRFGGKPGEIPLVGDDEIGVLAGSLRGLLASQNSQKIELQRLNSSLEQRVQERTQELTAANGELQTEIAVRTSVERELETARDTAVAASLAKSEFLAAMSHEIRTPMNSILGMADLLAETPLNTEQQQYVHIFRRAGDTLLTLINDILDLAKVEAGQFALDRRDFDLPDLLDRTVEILALRAQEKGLRLTCQIMPAVPATVHGDPDRLRQILVNLIGNAIKFTESGSVALKVERVGAQTLQFAVSDTGLGIPADALPTLFDNYTQVITPGARKQVGTGLGLAICKRLAELMGGRIWVESTPGAGSTFFFTAHLEPRATAPRPAPLADPVPATELAALSPLRILLADDSPDNRLLIAAHLRKTPYLLDTAENGAEALQKYKVGNYDLVLMDMQMPVLDGYEATAAIRDWEIAKGHPEKPIIALTAFALQDDAIRSLAAGCSAHLAKPIKKDALLAAIQEHTASSSRSHSLQLSRR